MWQEKWPDETAGQLLPMHHPAEAFFSLPFGCLAAAAASFVSDRGSDFSLDFGPAGMDVHMHVSVHAVAQGPAHWGGTYQTTCLILVFWPASQAWLFLNAV